MKSLTSLFGAARAERARAARVGMILDQSFNEIYIFDASTLRFTYANAGACRNLQYSLEELKRLTVADVKPEFTVREYGRLLEPLRSGRKAVVVLETVHQRKNGGGRAHTALPHGAGSVVHLHYERCHRAQRNPGSAFP